MIEADPCRGRQSDEMSSSGWRFSGAELRRLRNPAGWRSRLPSKKSRVRLPRPLHCERAGFASPAGRLRPLDRCLPCGSGMSASVAKRSFSVPGVPLELLRLASATCIAADRACCISRGLLEGRPAMPGARGRPIFCCIACGAGHPTRRCETSGGRGALLLRSFGGPSRRGSPARTMPGAILRRSREGPRSHCLSAFGFGDSGVMPKAWHLHSMPSLVPHPGRGS